MLRKGRQFNIKTVEPKKGQRVPLCSNSGKSRCPSLRYNSIEVEQVNINRAFDILFEATLEANKKIYGNTK